MANNELLTEGRIEQPNTLNNEITRLDVWMIRPTNFERSGRTDSSP